MKEAAEVISVVMLVLNIFIAVCTGMSMGMERTRGPVECEYHSILDLAPARVVVCELMRKRW